MAIHIKKRAVLSPVAWVLLGAAVTSTIGFTKGGWVTQRGLRKALTVQAQALAAGRNQAVAAALTPYCVQKSLADPNRYQVVLDVRAAKIEDREAVIEKAGWANPPGSDNPDYELAKSCLVRLNLF